jgi:hypothetical protein
MLGDRHGADAMAHVAEVFSALWEAEGFVLKAMCVQPVEEMKDAWENGML